MSATAASSSRLPGSPQLLLLIAGVIVAISILAGAPLARPLNGIGGILWIASAAWMLGALWSQPKRWLILAVSLAFALLYAGVIRPGEYRETIPLFLLAGAVVTWIAGADGLRWAFLVPALYFPLHIVIALGRVIASGGTRAVRTDPPPTAAAVPLSMIVAAALGGVIVHWWLNRKGDRA